VLSTSNAEPGAIAGKNDDASVIEPIHPQFLDDQLLFPLGV
jgi:hypothetical protein